MSSPTVLEPKKPMKPLAHAWWVILLAALALHWIATDRRIDRVNALSNSPTWSVDAPARDSSSPTGYENGQRKLIIHGHHNPSFSWITEAQIAAENGLLRLRSIDYDTAPDSRTIRRTAPYRWWLISTGWLYSFFQDEPLGYSIERGSLIADPILFALLLLGGSIYTFRYMGSFAATGFTIGAISLFPLASNFQPGAPDPHSLAWVFALGSILPLLASTFVAEKNRSVRSHFIVAGVFGGLGFWNDSTTQAPLLLAIALGALAFEYFKPRIDTDQNSTPTFWRTWGATGAIVILATSLFEWAPDNFSWSLDSINPIHAVIFWGVAEIIHAATTFSQNGKTGFGTFPLIRLAIGVLAVASWPTIGILSETGGLLAIDFYARELANHPNGGIASDLSAWFNKEGRGGAKFATLLPCLLVFILLIRVFTKSDKFQNRSHLIFVSIISLFVIVLAYYQLRWWNLFDVTALLLVTALFATAAKETTQIRFKTLGASLLVIPGIFVGFPAATENGEIDQLSQLDTQSLIERDFSYWINKRQGTEPNVLFSTPVFSGASAFYGGFKVIVSSDEANKVGYEAAARLASSDSIQESSILTTSRGITHIAIPLWDPMMDQLIRMGTGTPHGEQLPPNAFTLALKDWEMPAWVGPMNYPIPHEESFKRFELMTFAVQPEQEPELAFSRLADLFVERGIDWEMKLIKTVLANYPRSIHALGATANVDYALQERASLNETLETLIPYLSRRSARNLPADRRVSLASLFVRVNKIDLAKDQIEACFQKLDTSTLKALTPNAVASLIALSRALKIPFPSEELEKSAMELIPVNIRANFNK